MDREAATKVPSLPLMISICSDCHGMGGNLSMKWEHTLSCDGGCSNCPVQVEELEPCVSCNAVGRVLLA